MAILLFAAMVIGGRLEVECIDDRERTADRYGADLDAASRAAAGAASRSICDSGGTIRPTATNKLRVCD